MAYKTKFKSAKLLRKIFIAQRINEIQKQQIKLLKEQIKLEKQLRK